jgi:DUF4097 and DUF4098 domain-containing protein YvlB
MKKQTRFNAVITGLALCFAFANPSLVSAKDKVSETLEKTYALQKDGRIGLENVNGDVHIVAWDRAEVKLKAVKEADSKEELDDVEVQIDSSADSLRVRTKYPDSKTARRKNNSTSVEYELSVPEGSRLESISTVNGGVSIEGVSGRVDAKSVNGPVKAKGLRGKSDLSTVNGPVEASFAEFKGDSELKSVNGRVAVILPGNKDSLNAEISAETVHGGIQSELGVESKKGFPVGQKLKAKLGDGGPLLKVSTVNGGIQLSSAGAPAKTKKRAE